MNWPIIFLVAFAMIAAVLLRLRFGPVGGAFGAAINRALGDKGRRYAINGLYAATILVWIVLFFWSSGEERGGLQAIGESLRGLAPKP